jgi:acyl-CoA synthetase (AMP-forming)/AMP-acid ligase II
MISGSAPLLPEVQHFLKVVLCAPLVEGYGQTESTGALLFSGANDPAVKAVGGPVVLFALFRQTSSSNLWTFLKCSTPVTTLTVRANRLLEEKSGHADLESSWATTRTRRKLKRL